MIITGAEITDFTFRVNPDYKVITELDMEWYQVSNGNYHAVDRGTSADVYGTKIKTFGTETYINNIITQLEANRQSTAGLIRMSSFADDEHIFGEDIDYSGELSGYYTEISMRRHSSLNVFELDLALRLSSPSFSGTASFPAIACLQVGYTADANWTYNTYDSYYSDFSYQDHNADAGIFKGTYNLTQTQLRNLRRWHATFRDISFSLPGIGGVTYPFGPREGTGPWTVKALKLEEKRRFGLDRWLTEVTLARHYS